MIQKQLQMNMEHENEQLQETPKEKYESPEKRQSIIDDLRLIQ